MVNRKFKIVDESGLHARPASVVVGETSKFTCDIKLQYNERTVDMKSIIGLMSLALGYESEFEIICDGTDEAEALEGIAKALKDNGIAK